MQNQAVKTKKSHFLTVIGMLLAIGYSLLVEPFWLVKRLQQKS